MSLILEALKKLEREKQSPDRGFLVMAHVPWATAAAGRGGRRFWIVSGLLAIALAALAVTLPRIGRAPAHPEPAPAAPVAPVAQAPLAGGPGPGDLRRLDPRPGAEGPGVSQVPVAPGVTAPAPRVAPWPTTDPSVRSTPDEPPPSSTPAAGGELRLNAISQQDGRPVAILNERLVREGDVFDGIRVVRIGEAEVEVEVDGKRRIVRF